MSTYSVLDMLVSDSRGSGGDGEKLPPAKFKSHLIIFTSLYTMTMFTSYAIWGESLDELPFPVRLLCQILVNTTTIGYTFVPFLSALLQRYTFRMILAILTITSDNCFDAAAAASVLMPASPIALCRGFIPLPFDGTAMALCASYVQGQRVSAAGVCQFLARPPQNIA